MKRFTSYAWRLAGLIAAAAGIAACNPEPVSGGFKNTGELVALSGGDAGAAGACHTCHGMKGEGDGNLVPRLAGLNRGYLLRQLDFFVDGQRQHPQMSWIARRLDSEDRMRVAGYYAQMEPPLSAITASGSNCTGTIAYLYREGDKQRALASCASCHGASGEGGGSGNPALSGQPAAYISEQLRQWRSGERYGDPLGQMRRAAMALSEEEITALGVYLSRLGQGTQNRGFREECPPQRRRGSRNGA